MLDCRQAYLVGCLSCAGTASSVGHCISAAGVLIRNRAFIFDANTPGGGLNLCKRLLISRPYEAFHLDSTPSGSDATIHDATICNANLCTMSQLPNISALHINRDDAANSGGQSRRSSPDSREQSRSPPASMVDANGGFFDYTEEKHLHHVCCPIFPVRPGQINICGRTRLQYRLKRSCSHTGEAPM